MRFSALVVLLVSSLLFACGGSANEGGAGNALPDRFKEAHAIQQEISEDAGRAVEILESHGMTLDDWETLMAELEEDPELAEAYRTLDDE